MLKTFKYPTLDLYYIDSIKRSYKGHQMMVTWSPDMHQIFLSYAVPVFYYALPKYLQNDLECV